MVHDDLCLCCCCCCCSCFWQLMYKFRFSTHIITVTLIMQTTVCCSVDRTTLLLNDAHNLPHSIISSQRLVCWSRTIHPNILGMYLTKNQLSELRFMPTPPCILALRYLLLRFGWSGGDWEQGGSSRSFVANNVHPIILISSSTYHILCTVRTDTNKKPGFTTQGHPKGRTYMMSWRIILEPPPGHILHLLRMLRSSLTYRVHQELGL